MSHRVLLEGLESRNLMSASCAADLLSADVNVQTTSVVKVPLTTTVAPSTPLLGAFNVAGTYTQPFSRNPDAGSQYIFTGSGRKRSLGSFTMSGGVSAPGFIAQAQAHGYITLTSSQGTVTLKLIGPPQAPGSLPPTFSYKITSGTGAYALASGKGQLLVSASDVTQKFVFRFNQTA